MISADSKISHYKVVSALGVGGMGEVFLAQDTKLDRRVAIKILNDAQCKDEEILRRFKQEARAASPLNHPNIVTIYEIGELNEQQCYIAMEFVEGETLRSLLKSKKLTLEDALDIAIQTASALTAAHDAGIVHRDIKPENIMRRPDGLVKVLDFGLAKQTGIPSELSEIDPEAPTQEYHLTLPGMIMGTAAYMSPEQARGKITDARTDIWSFGVVLYEMITGRAPFMGETKSDVMAAILKNETPTIAPHAPEVPIELEHIINKTLGKDLDERYQTVKDLLSDLKIVQSELNADKKAISVGLFSSSGSISKQRQTGVLTEPAFLPKTGRRWLWLGVSALLLLVGFSLWYARQSPPSAQMNLASLVSSQITSWKSDLGEDSLNRARFSPDGKLIAFVAVKNGKNSIWLKQIGGGEAFTRKQDDADDRSPIWSPDGGTIAYFSDRGGRRGIWTMPALGGSSVLLAPLDGRGQLISWSKDGATIYFEVRQNLYALAVAQKQMTKLTNFDESQAVRRDFNVSPDEKQIVYGDKKDGRKDLWKADVHGANPTRLTDDAYEDGKPVWHPDGRRLIYNSNRNGVKQICLAFLDGQPNVQLTFSDNDSDVSDISADGARILYQSTKDDSDLWGANLADGKEFQLTSDIGAEFWQDVAPNGETLVYQAARRASVGDKLLNSLIVAQKIGGDNHRIELAADGFNPQWSPDGNHIAFLRFIDGKNNFWLTSATGGDARILTSDSVFFGGFTILPFNRFQKDYQWSPDSRSLIYCADRNGFSNVWQTAVDDTGDIQLSNNEDKNLRFLNPLFSPDANRIAWTGFSPDSQGKRRWSVWLWADGKIGQIYQSDAVVQLIGWSPSANELIFKSVETGDDLQTLPVNVNFLQISVDGTAPRLLFTAKEVYFQNIQLSPDRTTLAFVARHNGNNVIQTLSLTGGTTAKTLISSNDARVYFSSLSFAPDGKTLYYGKQANWQVISTIGNFK